MTNFLRVLYFYKQKFCNLAIRAFLICKIFAGVIKYFHRCKNYFSQV